MDKNVALLVHLLTLSFGLPLVILAQDEIQCPNPSEIEPCVCEINSDFGYDILLLDCSAVTSTEELQVAFQADFPTPVVDELLVRNATLDFLPAGVFGSKELKKAIISESRLRSVDGNAFAGSEGSLTWLDLSENQLQEFPFEEILSGLTQLSHLTLWRNSLSSIPSLSSQSLLWLNLAFNQIPSTEAPLFSGLENLETLYIGGNPLTELPNGLVSPLGKLKDFDASNSFISDLTVGSLIFQSDRVSSVSLNNNSIRAIEPGAIGGLSYDSWLWLGDNKLMALEENTFRPILQYFTNEYYGRIYVRNNPLLCECDMAWLFVNTSLLYHVEGNCWNGTDIWAMDQTYFEQNCFH
ncbi:unnamed protein product [Darwinula stevensoni]|uniref:Uncharacterized protein n=1 Tax=Darwinula stevensoni TaxID=69355 RepID=A0A7R8X4D2_9CRUS|nr:unnamed protein product [Darwinula stevensoni]CAG0885901.1 unnamed protein product [Darwinula stevensoni]